MTWFVLACLVVLASFLCMSELDRAGASLNAISLSHLQLHLHLHLHTCNCMSSLSSSSNSASSPPPCSSPSSSASSSGSSPLPSPSSLSFVRSTHVDHGDPHALDPSVRTRPKTWHAREHDTRKQWSSSFPLRTHRTINGAHVPNKSQPREGKRILTPK